MESGLCISIKDVACGETARVSMSDCSSAGSGSVVGDIAKLGTSIFSDVFGKVDSWSSRLFEGTASGSSWLGASG